MNQNRISQCSDPEKRKWILQAERKVIRSIPRTKTDPGKTAKCFALSAYSGHFIICLIQINKSVRYPLQNVFDTFHRAEWNEGDKKMYKFLELVVAD